MIDITTRKDHTGDGYTFDFLAMGRSGEIIYAENDKLLGVHWEISGVKEMDILISCNLQSWRVPSGESIPYEKQREILARLREYLKKKGMKSDIDLPQKIELQNDKCVWTDCHNRRINKYAYCLEHLDASILRK